MREVYEAFALHLADEPLSGAQLIGLLPGVVPRLRMARMDEKPRHPARRIITGKSRSAAADLGALSVRYRHIVQVTVFVLVTTTCLGTNALEIDQRLERLRLASDRITEPDAWRDVGQVYYEVFSALSSAQLRVLSTDRRTSVALQACAALHDRFNGREVRSSRGSSDQERSQGDAFIRFFQCRTGTQVPAWWKKAYFEPNTVTTFDYDDVADGPLMIGEPLEAPASVKLTLTNKIVTVKRGQMTFSFPQSALDSVKSDPRAENLCNAAINESCGVLAIYSTTGDATLICVVNGKVKWQTKAWAQGAVAGASGVWLHDLDLVIDDQRITVFGTGTGGQYVESFRRDTGKCLYRFSRGYWLQRWGKNS